PLHLGVTEAGDGEDGRIKSAVGIGALLSDGIGDTIRVSLSEAPEAEVPVARKLVDYIVAREGHESIQASLAPGYDPISPTRRLSRGVKNIGGGAQPIVIANCENGDFTFGATSVPDFMYLGKGDFNELFLYCPVIVDAFAWKDIPEIYPCFTVAEMEQMHNCPAAIHFIRLTDEELTDAVLEQLKQNPKAVVWLQTNHQNGVGALRAAMHRLMTAACDVPVVLYRSYSETDVETLQLKAAADFGTLLLDGFCDGIMLDNSILNTQTICSCMFGILQAARTRISKTEYISCPSCGRTLYDLQQTIARIKEATSHLKGLKIGIMGCIVNGPGEMADADYGYVGAGKNRISLYKGKECVLKNIPEEEAVERLIQLIKDNGDWVD
ncbi:MAG: flavodoxin-dependent (E)-4-hydroxy-3-methylbut-2-enyl-diphosphate synthase, partial [Parabacteroides sp.]|nr:flavodoxin-dependent (E)-4-hydroxy-3-methylbut-2-enyl-diphosphate synthase [Parabacteroides sp.]